VVEIMHVQFAKVLSPVETPSSGLHANPVMFIGSPIAANWDADIRY
jgi:hypothetical protein